MDSPKRRILDGSLLYPASNSLTGSGGVSWRAASVPPHRRISCCPRASRIPGSSRIIPEYPGLKLESCLAGCHRGSGLTSPPACSETICRGAGCGRTRTSGSVGGQGQQRPWSTRPRLGELQPLGREEGRETALIKVRFRPPLPGSRPPHCRQTLTETRSWRPARIQGAPHSVLPALCRCGSSPAG